MITLEEYKKDLISHYNWPCDSTKEEQEKRKIYLSKEYSDDFLQRIIIDTYEFIKDIFASDTINDGYCEFEVDEYQIDYINLNLHGGWSSDSLYNDSKGRIISKNILNNVFGNYFSIEIKENETEFYDGDIVSFSFAFSLYMQGFPNNMEEIKTNLFSKQKLKTIY